MKRAGRYSLVIFIKLLLSVQLNYLDHNHRYHFNFNMILLVNNLITKRTYYFMRTLTILLINPFKYRFVVLFSICVGYKNDDFYQISGLHRFVLLR